MSGNIKQANSRAKSWAVGSALAGAGLIVGVVAAGTLTAHAASTTSAASASSAAFGTDGGAAADSAKSVRPDEKLLTGDTADEVKAAALGKYPDATVVRVETDSDGVYEAHLRKADGTPVTVEVNKDFAVTGDELVGPPVGGRQGPPDRPNVPSNAGGSSTSG